MDAGRRKPVEENGYFHRRGTLDMKTMNAIWLDSLIRLHQQNYKP